MAAILEQHLVHVAEVGERARVPQHGMQLADIAMAVVTAFVDAKMEQPDASKALYAVAEEHGGAVFVPRATTRRLRAITATLTSTPDAGSVDLALVSSMTLVQ